MSCSDQASTLEEVIECIGRLGWEYELQHSEALHGYGGELLAIEGHQATVRSPGGPEAIVLAREPYEALLAALIGVQSVLYTFANTKPGAPASMLTPEQSENVKAAILRAIEKDQQAAEVPPTILATYPLSLSSDAVIVAYQRYDADPRAHGPEDFQAFREAVKFASETTRKPSREEPEQKIDRNIILPPALHPAKVPRAEHTSMTDRVLCAYEEFMRYERPGQFGAQGAQAFADAVQLHMGGTFVPCRGHEWNAR